MPSLKTFRRMTGLPDTVRRWKDAAEMVKAGQKALVENEAPSVAIEWPQEWTDRGHVRKRSEYLAPEGFVYDWQIAALLGHRTVEYVRSYHLYKGPDSTCLPGGPPFPEPADTFDGVNMFAHDEHYGYYASEADARRIYERIKYDTERNA